LRLKKDFYLNSQHLEDTNLGGGERSPLIN